MKVSFCKEVFLPKNQYVATKDGLSLPSQVMESTLLAKDFRDNTSKLYLTPTATSTTQECVEIETDSFGTLLIPKNAYLSTQRGRIRATHLQEGDSLDFFLASHDTPKNQSDCEKDWDAHFEMSGKVLASLIYSGTLRRAKNKEGIIDQVQYVINLGWSGIATELFEDPNLHHPFGVELKKFFGCAIRTFYSKEGKQKTTTLLVPKNFFGRGFYTKEEMDTYAMAHPMSFLKSFLRTVFTLDGSIGPDQSRIRLCSSVLDRLHSIRLMLARFGIFSRVQQHHKTKGENESKVKGAKAIKKDHYFLLLQGKDLKRFSDTIGFDDVDFKGKRQHLDAILKKREKTIPRPTIDACVYVGKVSLKEVEVEKMVLEGDDRMEDAPISVQGVKMYF